MRTLSIRCFVQDKLLYLLLRNEQCIFEFHYLPSHARVNVRNAVSVHEISNLNLEDSPQYLRLLQPK